MNDKPKKIKLIIADDHPVFRSGLEAALKNMSIITNIAQASSGPEVFQLLTHEHYDIVLMDISMKPMSGIEATEIINKRFPRTKVIALSMHEDAQIITDILNRGAVGYLIKNADTVEIQKAIEEVHNGRKYYSLEVSRLIFDYINKKKDSLSDLEKEETLNKERYREILFLLCQDCSNKEIADILFLSERTIEDYRSQLKELTGAKKAYGFVRYAMDHGVLSDNVLNKKFAKHLSKKKEL